MNSTFKRAAAGLSAFAIAGGAFLGLAGSASAASSPLPWMATETGSGEQVGTLSFYDGSGNQVTSGTLDSTPFAKYAVTSGGLIAGSGNADGATAYMYTPSTGDPASWGSTQLSTTAPLGPGVNAGYPDLPASIQSSNREVVPLGLSANDATSPVPSTYPAPNDKVYEVRVLGATDQKWYNADIELNPTANTWTQVYPAAPQAVTTAISAITASPASPAPSGTTSVDLAADLTAGDNTVPAGTVELFDGNNDLGAATVSNAGHITKTAAGLTDGSSHSYQFKFTPTGNGYSSSQSAALQYSVHGAAASTTTLVSGPSNGTVGVPVTYTATVTSASGSPSGTVQFKVDGTNLGAPLSVANAASNGISYTPSDTNPHTITAAYSSNDPADYVNSADTTGITIQATQAASTPDPQNVTVHVPAGSLVISTPYTANHPLSLGTLQLSSDGTHMFTDPVNFGDPTAAATDVKTNLDDNPSGSTANGVTITDTRPGSTGWTAHVVSNDFTSGANTITGHDLEFLHVTPKYIQGNNIQSIAHADVPDVRAGGDFARISGAAGVGTGTVNVTGALDLHNVPTSTQPGDYTATLTFTIS